MVTTYELVCESAVSDCRFVNQSENESTALELAQQLMNDGHDQDLIDDELRDEYLLSV